MTILEVCQLLSRTPLSVALRESRWGFAVVEMAHLTALAVFGGTVLIGTLRVAEVVLPAPMPVIVADLGRLFAVALLGLILSGSLLFVESPLRYYANPAFRVKLTLLVVGIVLSVWVALGRRPSGTPIRPHSLKWLMFGVATVWFATAVAGRVIGVL